MRAPVSRSAAGEGDGGPVACGSCAGPDHGDSSRRKSCDGGPRIESGDGGLVAVESSMMSIIPSPNG